MFALIGWIGRFLLILFVVRLVLRMFTPSPARGGPAAGGARPRGPFGGGPFAGRQPQPEKIGGQLVRCSRCGTHVPETSVISVSRGGDILKFCSDTCRQAYAVAHP